MEAGKSMSPAKTNAERQSALKARKKAAGLVSLKNVWVHPDDVQAMRDHASLLERRRASVTKVKAT